jgi:hypothetical protein
LQAVAEGFVVEQSGFDFGGLVPVVDQVGVHRVYKRNSTSGGIIAGESGGDFPANGISLLASTGGLRLRNCSRRSPCTQEGRCGGL